MIEPKQELMPYLYGYDTLDKIKERLNYLDSSLNEIVEKIAYQYFWSRDGISLQEKSLITLSALISTSKIEQIHLQAHCFLNTGWDSNAFLQLLECLEEFLTKEYKTEIEKILMTVSGSRLGVDKNKDIALRIMDEHDLLLAKIAASIATHDYSLSNKYFIRSINMGLEQKVRHSLIHLIVYCGFPTVVNGFSILMECVTELNSTKEA